jgi:hypothetical protein
MDKNGIMSGMDAALKTGFLEVNERSGWAIELSGHVGLLGAYDSHVREKVS